MGAPYLRELTSPPEHFRDTNFPFNIPAFQQGIDLQFKKNVTFFVGENGSGKSTLLEGIAECCGFNPEGGDKNHFRDTFIEKSAFAKILRLSWLPKTSEGFFMRAESFYNFATYLDQISTLKAYGGKSLHHQSHGESFLALFDNRFEQGLYILDEPEAALSPQRQLSLLKIIYNLEAPNQAQFIIATHSPILLAYPGATLYSFTENGIRETAYKETDHYSLTKDFLNAPERYFKHLFQDTNRESSEA
jgi:predicted ATPase